ncbi:MAG: hypothetical protein OER86_09770, partial [Phycisphaerae bacterium]|nr:hypothetical protein [Phycisphaerae bacterium]
MKTVLLGLAVLLSLGHIALAEPPLRRYLYITTPDGAQTQGRSGTGILVFDIDDGHKFVRRIDVPIFKEGLRGFTGNTKTKCVYYSTTNR